MNREVNPRSANSFGTLSPRSLVSAGCRHARWCTVVFLFRCRQSRLRFTHPISSSSFRMVKSQRSLPLACEVSLAGLRSDQCQINAKSHHYSFRNPKIKANHPIPRFQSQKRGNQLPRQCCRTWDEADLHESNDWTPAFNPTTEQRTFTPPHMQMPPR